MRLLMFLLLVIPAFSYAQVWSLKKCIDQAEENNLTIQRAELIYEMDEWSLKQAKSNLLPSLMANANQNVNFGRSIDPSSNQFVQQTVRSNNYDLSSSLLLFNGGQTHYAIAQNRQTVEANRYALQKEKNNLSIQILTAYLQILLNTEQLQFTSELKTNNETQMYLIQKKVAAGTNSEQELELFQAQMNSDELLVSNILVQLNTNKLRLTRLMQVPYDQAYELEKILSSPSNLQKELSKDSLCQLAFTHLPQLKESSLRKNSAWAYLQAIRGNYFPKLTLNTGIRSIYSSQNKYLTSNASHVEVPYFSQLDQNLSEYVTLNLNVPLYNKNITRISTAKAKVQFQLAMINETEGKAQLTQEVTLAHSNFQAASSRYITAQTLYQSRQRSFSFAQKKWEAGTMNPYEYLIEKNNLIKARMDSFQAKYEYLYWEKMIGYYTNGIIE